MHRPRTIRSQAPLWFRSACLISWRLANERGPFRGRKEDYESTWLAPERLLLFVQFADGSDSMAVTGMLDGQPLDLRPAYSSIRTDPACFVGFYVDLSRIAPDVQHTIELRVPQVKPAQLQGIFFDNVTPQLTELFTQ